MESLPPPNTLTFGEDHDHLVVPPGTEVRFTQAGQVEDRLVRPDKIGLETRLFPPLLLDSLLIPFFEKKMQKNK